MAETAPRQELPKVPSSAPDHDRAAESNQNTEAALTIGRRNRSSAEQRRLQALRCMNSIRVKTLKGERTALYNAIVRDTWSPIEELEPVKPEPNPVLARFRKLSRVDRSLFLRAAQKTITLIKYEEEDVCLERYGMTLKELEAQLFEEASRRSQPNLV